MSSSTVEFLSELANQDIRLWLDDGQLRFSAPDGVFTPTIKEELVARKAEVIAFLSEAEQVDEQAIPLADRSESLSLSFAQQRLWILSQLESDSAAYNIPAALVLRGKVNADNLRLAFAQIIARHESLRTVFQQSGDEAEQIIIGAEEFSSWWSFEDYSEQSFNDESLSELKQNKALANSQHIFSLSDGPLFLVKLIALPNEEYLLLINMHHIISDATSIEIIVAELAAFYSALENGNAIENLLPDLPIQYGDFSQWQRQQLSGDSFEKLKNYWQQNLSDTEVLQLPIDKPRPPIFTGNGGEHHFLLPESLSNSLEKFAQEKGVTLFTLFLSAYQILLSRYTGQEAINVGTPLANRNSAQTEGLIGFFVNTLVLRSELDLSQSFNDFLQNVKDTVLNGFEYEQMPFEMLVETLVKERDLSTSPLFQTMFTLTASSLADSSEQQNDFPIEFEFLSKESKSTKFDLSLSLAQSKNGINASFEYCSDLFFPSTIESMGANFIRLLESLLANPELALASLDFVDPLEIEKQVVTWNDTQKSASNLCVHELFEKQAELTPDAIALVFADKQFTYQELNSRSTQLANYLQKQGLEIGQGVAILLNRSEDLLISLLGVLKAGAYYIPVDPEYPKARIDYVLEHSEPSIVLCESALQDLAQGHSQIICLDEKRADIAACSADNYEFMVSYLNKDVVYTIYTSGSTGKPKGVVIDHKAFVNFLLAMRRAVGIVPEDRLLAVTSLSFDIAGLELFLPLLHGARVVIASREDSLDVDRLQSLLNEQDISFMQATPATWQMLCSTNWRKDGTDKTLKVLCGGEALPQALVQKLLARNIDLFNMYGPTETTVWSSVKHITHSDDKVLIGQPIDNTQMYVLDSERQALPIGAIGELYIGGSGISLGYLKQDELTQERFVRNPFVDLDKRASFIIYQTGDLARWTQDGELECLGRVDSQVKVRGYRIELGEIENALELLDAVKACAVITQTLDAGGVSQEQIVAYVVLNSDTDIALIKQAFSEQLPSYMLPSFIEVLSELPLTPNDKIDRKALPAPSSSNLEFIEPRNESEKLIADIWCEVLGLDKVSVVANFFELGGQSLLATQVLSKLRAALNKNIPLRSIFEQPTIEGLALALEQIGSTIDLGDIPLVDRTETLALSFGQRRLWFLDQLSPGSNFYNMPMALKISGDLDKAKLEQAFQRCIARHEILRTVFIPGLNSSEPQQVISDSASWSLESEEMALPTEKDRLAHLAQYALAPFDLHKGPLLRAKVFQQGDKESYLVLVLHHIIADAHSIELLVQDLVTFYLSGESASSQDVLQYADYAAWQRDYLSADRLAEQVRYWQEQLADVPALAMPLDKARPPVESHRGASVAFTLDAKESQALKKLGEQNGATFFMTLMAAFQVLLSRYSNQHDFAIGSAISLRQHPQLENALGFYVNTLALRSDVHAPELGSQSFAELLLGVKATSLAAYSHQDLPFEQVVDELRLPKDMSLSPVFQAMLVFAEELSTLDAGIDIADQNLRIEQVRPQHNSAKFDLNFELSEREGALVGHMEYASDLFLAGTIEKLLAHFKNLIKSIVAEPQANIHALNFLSPAEIEEQLYIWNKSEQSYPDNICIHTLFEKEVSATPEAIAIVQGDKQLSYEQVNVKANQLARFLQSKGLALGDKVGVCLPRSPDMIVSVLAVLKAGGTYIPMDVMYPDERLNFFIEDSSADIVLSNAENAKRFSPYLLTQVICLDDTLIQSELEEASVQNLDLNISPEQYLYALYTSGSTGQPNCTASSHQKFSNLLNWYCQGYGDSSRALKAEDKLLLISAFGFDLSQKNLFAALVCGGQLHLPSCDMYDADALAQQIEEAGITWLNCAPSAFYPLIVNRELTSLRTVFLGGEPIALERIGAWYKNSQCLLVNSYGPSECTDISAFHILEKDIAKHYINGITPIGRVNDNIHLYIFNEAQQLLPQGAVGELYVGGLGVGSGYLNNEELTNDRFIENPHVAGERIYKTGDLARYRADGSIEYLGRNDYQVKIRGIRIELGEIENYLLKQTKVKEATVIVWDEDPNDPKLVAYLVPTIALDENGGEGGDAGEEKTASFKQELKNTLKQKFPAAMVPSALVLLTDLPLTPNGKIDRKALPAPEVEQALYLQPETDAEITIAKIWQDILGLDKVSLLDDFFELGAHSLLAARMMSQVREALQKDLPLSLIFENPQLNTFAASASGIRTAAYTAIEQVNRSQNLIASFGQKRLWFLDRLNPGSAFYNIAATNKIVGAIDEEAFAAAVEKLVQRHESLRTRFHETSGELYQDVLETSDSCFEFIDAIGKPEKDLIDLSTELSQQSFVLEQGPLFKLYLIQAELNEYYLVLVIHHIIADGWSAEILLAELIHNYCQPLQVLPPLSIQYADYAHWQNQAFQAESYQDSLGYWQETLSEVEPIQFPIDKKRPAIQSHNGERISFEIDPSTYQRVQHLSESRGDTLFMLLFAAYQVLLAKYSNGGNFAVGTPVANRDRSELEAIIGFFANTIALSNDVAWDICFNELLEKVKVRSLSAFSHQHVPFEQVVEALNLEREMSHSPIFQCMFVFNQQALFSNVLDHDSAELDLEVSTVESHSKHAKFDLTLELGELNDQLLASFEYNTDLFERETIEALAEHFQVLLANLVQEPEAALSAQSMLSAKDIAYIESKAELPPQVQSEQSGLHSIFEEQANKHAKNIALSDGDEHFSYEVLNARANVLANYLVARGIAPKQMIPLYVDRSADAIVGTLAILKAGCAYVPIDSIMPLDRVKFIIEDIAGAEENPFVLSQNHLTAELIQQLGNVNVLHMEDAEFDNIDEKNIADETCQNLNIDHHVDNLAYVISTSGTTGQPKGVPVSHRNICRLFTTMQERFQFNEDGVWTLFHSLSFDFSAWEIWGALLHGGRAVVVPKLVAQSTKDFYELVAKQKVTVMSQTPSAFRMFVEEDQNHSAKLGLNKVILGGEPLEGPSMKVWVDRYGLDQPELINIYGPTETTVLVTYHKLEASDIAYSESKIGKPLADAQAYVLDQFNQPVPNGVIGELHVGGAGVGQGYLHRAELTAEKFVSLAILEGAEQFLYRTGDLVKELEDGNLIYCGRIDDQVKIRGYRIELGEIENVLLKQNGVTSAFVTVKEFSLGEGRPLDKRIVAYLVCDEDFQDLRALKAALSQFLPGYMLPSTFVMMDVFPLTSNGKVDRRALPEPSYESTDYQEPRTDLEKSLAAIWQEVLGVEKVGLLDNFFELGGHSLLATKLVARVNESLQKDLALASLFEKPVLEDFCAVVSFSADDYSAAMTVQDRPKALPLSFSQQRLWFLDKLNEGSAAYHIPFVLKLEGEIDSKALEASFVNLISQHEILRTVFRQQGEEAEQVVLDEMPWALEASSIASGLKETELLQHLAHIAMTPFDLGEGPLFRASLVKQDDSHYLVLVLHHIISDAWSINIMVRDIIQHYLLATNVIEQNIVPSATGLQYADYAIWQRHNAQGEHWQSGLEYWQQQLQNTPVIDLPHDYLRPAIESHRGDTYRLHLDKDVTDKLRAFSQEQQVSLFMSLLSALEILLARYSGQSDFSIGTPIANRSRAEVQETLGFFANTLALRAQVNESQNFGSYLQNVKAKVLQAQSYQDIPFEQVVDLLNLPQDLSHSPVFQVMFVLNEQSTEHQLKSWLEDNSIGDLGVSPVSFDSQQAKFDLNVSAQVGDDDIAFEFEYNTDIFASATIENLAENYFQLISGLLAQQDKNVADISYLAESSQSFLAQEGKGPVQENNTGTTSLSQLFIQQAQAQPDQTCISYHVANGPAVSLSYIAADEQCNQLANYLQSKGIQTNDKVAVCLEPSLHLPLAVLALMKIGAAYIPLDPSSPKARIDLVLKESQAELLLTQKGLLSDDLAKAHKLIEIDTDEVQGAIEEQDKDFTQNLDLAEVLAYIIYTSGSTGVPKGVMVEHRALLNYLLWANDYYQVDQLAGSVSILPLSFDAVITTLFTPWLCGKSVNLCAKDVDIVSNFVNSSDSYLFKLTPSHFSFYQDLLKENKASQHQFVIGGEQLRYADIECWLENLSKSTFTNEYGPTESTVGCIAQSFTHGNLSKEEREELGKSTAMPVGKAIANTEFVLLDQERRLVAPGVKGEIYIGGDSLARGYLGPEDSADNKKFIQWQGRRFYQSGDMARYLSDGNLLCLGREDEQIKLRGVRIETGDIEQVFLGHAKVQDAKVILCSDEQSQQQFLAAYVVGGDVSEELLTRELKEKAIDELPLMMRPQSIIVCDAFKLTDNGKLDISALPAASLQQRQYLAPSTGTQIFIAELWQELLSQEQMGLLDNFFELGGHSLLATRCLSRINENFQIQMPLRAIFEMENVEELAAHIDTTVALVSSENNDDEELEDIEL